MHAKLLADEKIAAIAEREITKAVKAETKRILIVIREAVAENRQLECKDGKRAVTAALKSIVSNIKEGTTV
jgi:hypothetical protein